MPRTANPEKIKLDTMKATIKAKLLADPAWVERAIKVLYQLQTSDEQATQETGHENCQGFNKPDARRMSFVADWLNKSPNNHLSREKALGVYGVKLQKYAGQLAKIALAKQTQG